jgi:hypothetical protein
MTDDSDTCGTKGAPHQKETARDSRHERLKLALRDNLKRRKSQAKTRDDKARDDKTRDDKARDDNTRGKMTDAPSNDHEDALDDDTGRDRGQ